MCEVPCINFQAFWLDELNFIDVYKKKKLSIIAVTYPRVHRRKKHIVLN